MKIKLDKGADFLNAECAYCGKRFHLKPSALKRFKTHYCSKECQNKARKEYMRGEGNHQYGLRGRANASWKGHEKKLSSYGYVEIRVEGHPFADNQGWIFEHRFIAETYLLNDENSVEINGKRYLSPDYCVHHIDFDRTNNDVGNLLVMRKERHMMLHSELNPQGRNEKGQFVKDDAEAIKVKRTTFTAIIPKRQSIGAAGYDLCIDSDKPVIIPPHSTVMVQSGIAFEIPKGYFGAVYARSGISTREGIRPATCVSVIDSDYRGSVGLPLHNDTDKERVIEPYARVAQIVFQKALIVNLELVEELEETERGVGGFGSTGK